MISIQEFGANLLAKDLLRCVEQFDNQTTTEVFWLVLTANRNNQTM